MAMNFWEAQKRARSRTTLFLILFLLMTFVVGVFVELAMRAMVEDYDQESVPWMGLIYGLVTLLVAGFQYVNFRLFGGAYVAESLGAQVVDPESPNLKKRQLLNMVEEMALASSQPMPSVYILPANQINAFAAGLTPKSAAITVTTGALNSLNREELQGVIGHEFGHVYNGDMVISLRLAALLMGFFFLLYFGLRLMQYSSYVRRSDDERGGNPAIAVAIIFMIAGAITWFFGSILKAAVSREREYLADACAVQFTRNPNGIVNALRKIGQEQVRDMPSTGASYSHLYLDDRSSFSGLFATHPPLKKRIAAILGKEYIPEEWQIPNE
ncbi:MAG: M48 family metallopeptidase [Parachlamydia sp.]|nr:M48 family metallopeptidase [Parachlamydia sp.]